jgi:hypothetical protein
MSGRERRTASRYVVGGLLFEVCGVLHETLDVSHCAVAIEHKPEVDYSRINTGIGRFVSRTVPNLNRDVRSMHYITRRAGLVVLGYEIGCEGWEHVLETHDVRADMKQLEDVFA